MLLVDEDRKEHDREYSRLCTETMNVSTSSSAGLPHIMPTVVVSSILPCEPEFAAAARSVFAGDIRDMLDTVAVSQISPGELEFATAVRPGFAVEYKRHVRHASR